MLTSVGARGSYLLEDVTVISTELVRLYRLVGLCRLLSRRDIRGHCLGRFSLTVVQALLRGEHLSRRIITDSVGGVLCGLTGLSSVTVLCRVAILSSVAALCRVAVLCVSLSCAVTSRNTRRRAQCRS